MGDDELDTLEKVLKKLEETADAYIAATAVADAHLAEIRRLLPVGREMGAGAAQMGRSIRGIYADGTISLWTKNFAPADRKGAGRRKASARPPQSP